ncbi:Cytochrome P450, partial [Amanita muscaria]
MSTTILLSALLGVSAYLIFRRANNKCPPLPPGPWPKPIIANTLDFPLKKPWVQYLKMSKQFNSSIIYLYAGGNHVVVLNTLEDAIELLEKRSANYSSRPTNPVIDLMGFQDVVMTLPYGDAWRKQRRLLERGLKKDAMPLYRHVQAEKVHLLLEQLLDDPVNFSEHFTTLAVGITMATGFGYDVIPGQKDDITEPACFALNEGADLSVPGRTLIAMFGFLRHIPPWVPGATTQKLGARIRQAVAQSKNEPYESTKRKIAAGKAKNSIMKELIEANTKEDGVIPGEEALKNAMSAVYLAGVDALKIPQTVFALAMMLYPAVQKKAQEEIDRVVGLSRLPTLADRVSLPYVDALYREVLRWRPGAPLSFAHVTLKDDEYKGFHIPKGSLVMPNVWAVTRNEEKYPEPESFHPERFLKSDRTLNEDTVLYAFGFGRRYLPITKCM